APAGPASPIANLVTFSTERNSRQFNFAAGSSSTGFITLSNTGVYTDVNLYDLDTSTASGYASYFDNLGFSNSCGSASSAAVDADGDGDVDADDFAQFQQCYTGAAGTLPSSSSLGYPCACFDAHSD